VEQVKIDIQKIVRPVRLGDYAPEYGGQLLHVWVNPPRQMRLDYQQIADELSQASKELELIVKSAMDAQEAGKSTPESEEEVAGLVSDYGERLEELARRLYAWFAVMWSQAGDEDTRWTTDDVVELVEACLDADPALWAWIQDEHWRLVREHREGLKKK
jgi:hypothetical protein